MGRMPAISPIQLVDAIIDAVGESGYSAVLVSPVRSHPRKFILSGQGLDRISTWVYAWTLTFGGRPSLPNEFRIQMTTVSSPLSMNPNGATVLIGYEPDSGMFAGFDLSRHSTFTTGSPSVQIDIQSVRKSLQYGLTFDRKSNDEIALGIRPDQLVAYVLNAEHLHKYGRQPETFRLLQRAAELQPIAAPAINALPEQRRLIVQTVSRLSRNANFRQQVLQAYDNRCAVTRMQLRLIDAAHIVPVGIPESTDHVTNGLALSPTYHRAFDNGLIYLDESYVMKVNPSKATELATLRLDGVITGFKRPLGKILLPPDQGQWPKIAYIRQANRVRMI